MKIKTIYLFLPYILGLAWICVHPILSIVTGELKCRGLYIDEHQFEIYSHTTDPYPIDRNTGFDTDDLDLASINNVPNGNSDGNSFNLCRMMKAARIHNTNSASKQGKRIGNYKDNNINNNQYNPPITCHTHELSSSSTFDSFDVLKILPLHYSSPTEAIVFILPPPPSPSMWMTSDVHACLLNFIHRISGKRWLAKGILIISPHRRSNSRQYHQQSDSRQLEEFVEQFLNVYYSSPLHHFAPSSHSQLDSDTTIPGIESLPNAFNSFILRQLLVLDIHQIDQQPIQKVQPQANKNGKAIINRLDILPQGKNGLLPNLDLVAGMILSYSRTVHRFRQEHRRSHHTYKEMEIQVHPYDLEWLNDGLIEKEWSVYKYWSTSIMTKERKNWLKHWAKDLAGLVAFMMSLALGPQAPHAPALSRGIDSLTISATIPSSSASNRSAVKKISPNTAILFETIEHLIRPLSSLHERLHHTVTYYLLPSPAKFVSNGEYIYPCILLLLPLILRSVVLTFVELNAKTTCWKTNIMLSGKIFCLAFLYVSFGLLLMRVLLENRLQSGSSKGEEKLINGMKIGICTIYLLAFVMARKVWKNINDDNKRKTKDASGSDNKFSLDEYRKSLQLITCLSAIYLHAPLAIAHVSLAIPSALFWTPILALPSYKDDSPLHLDGKIERIKAIIKSFMKMIRKGLKIAFIVLTWPPLFLVPKIFQGCYTDYVCFVFAPLHFLITIWWLF